MYVAKRLLDNVALLDPMVFVAVVDMVFWTVVVIAESREKHGCGKENWFMNN